MLDPDQLLEYTNKLRREALTELTKEGPVPSDKASKELFNNLLTGMDKIALEAKKEKLKEKELENQEGMIGMVSELLKSVNDTSKEFEGRRMIEITEEIIPNAKPVNGELDINPPQLDYEDFID